jgi:hypothetical protein
MVIHTRHIAAKARVESVSCVATIVAFGAIFEWCVRVAYVCDGSSDERLIILCMLSSNRPHRRPQPFPRASCAWLDLLCACARALYTPPVCERTPLSTSHHSKLAHTLHDKRTAAGHDKLALVVRCIAMCSVPAAVKANLRTSTRSSGPHGNTTTRKSCEVRTRARLCLPLCSLP